MTLTDADFKQLKKIANGNTGRLKSNAISELFQKAGAEINHENEDGVNLVFNQSQKAFLPSKRAIKKVGAKPSGVREMARTLLHIKSHD